MCLSLGFLPWCRFIYSTMTCSSLKSKWFVGKTQLFCYLTWRTYLKKMFLRARFLLQPSSQLLNLTPKRCPDMITVLNPVSLGIQPATSQSQFKPAETTLCKENTKCCFSFIGYFTLRFVVKKNWLSAAITVTVRFCSPVLPTLLLPQTWHPTVAC